MTIQCGRRNIEKEVENSRKKYMEKTTNMSERIN
jgi:hypothetical protein